MAAASKQRVRSLLPALGRRVIAAASIDPALALWRALALPEWRPGLEEIHDEFARCERFAAMLTGHRDKHNLVERPQFATRWMISESKMSQRVLASVAIFSSSRSVMPG